AAASYAPNRYDPQAKPTTLASIAGIDFSSVAIGFGETCAIGSGDEKVYCFGLLSTSKASPVPVEYNDLNPVQGVMQLGAGDGWWCALTHDSRIYCWGSQNYSSKAPVNSGAAFEVTPLGT